VFTKAESETKRTHPRGSDAVRATQRRQDLVRDGLARLGERSCLALDKLIKEKIRWLRWCGTFDHRLQVCGRCMPIWSPCALCRHLSQLAGGSAYGTRNGLDPLPSGAGGVVACGTDALGRLLALSLA